MPGDRRDARRQALLVLLRAEGLDGWIVAHLPNVRYLTGFSGSAALLAVLERETVLVSDSRYRTQAEAEAGHAVRVEIAPEDLWHRLWEVLGEYPGIEVLGFEAHALTVAEAQRMWEKGPERLVLRPGPRLVERLRVSKDADEVEAIRRAAALAHEALAATLATVHVGERELDVAARLERELRMRGSEWHPFPTIVAAGPRSALPHARTSARPIAAGDWLLLDFGARVDGYCADITRTVVVGRAADERQRTLYALVEEAQRTARGRLRAGLTGQEADALARTVIEAHGWGDAFGHSLGHGLGLEVHEAPRLSKTNDSPLPVGAVVTVEPGIYVPGWGGVRIEDDVYLGAEAAELLTDGETELRELV